MCSAINGKKKIKKYIKDYKVLLELTFQVQLCKLTFPTPFSANKLLYNKQ